MADSPALRSRRYRAHRSGSHVLCHHRLEPGVMPDASCVPAPDGNFDAAAELALLAGRLSAAYAKEPSNASLARELRMTLQAMMGPGGGVDAELAEFLSGFGDA